MVGNSSTSRMEVCPVSSMTSRSTPMPSPPWRHPVFQRGEEVLVHIVGLVVPRRLQGRLGLEAFPLIDGIVKLGEGVGMFPPQNKQLEPLGILGILRASAWPAAISPPDGS